MGFFSFITSDTHEPIMNAYSPDGATACKMLDDKGNVWIEENYEGYGEFGGVDFYQLTDFMNGGEGDRVAGIEKCDVNNFDPAPASIKTPRLVSLDCTSNWADLQPSKNEPNQGYWS